MSEAEARVNYLEDGRERYIKGLLLEENQDYIKIQLDKYIVTISKRVILKLEVTR